MRNGYRRRLGQALQRRHDRKSAKYTAKKSRDDESECLAGGSFNTNGDNSSPPRTYEDETQSEGSSSDRSIAESTRKIAVLTAVLATIAVISAFITAGQWWEIHNGGADTHDLAVAAGVQAKATQGQLDILKAQMAPEVRFTFKEPPQLARNQIDNKIDNRIEWNTYFMNFGRTDAINFKVSHLMSIKGEPFKTFDGAEEYVIDNRLTPSIPGYFSTFSRDRYDFDGFAAAIKVDNGIRLRIEATYQDFSNKQYSFFICYTFLNNGAVGQLTAADCKK